MLTKEDLINIRVVMHEELSGLEKGMIRLEERVTRLEERMTSLENRMTSAEGEIAYIKENMVTQKDFNALSDRVDKLENDFQSFERKIDRLSDHSHNKFMLIENDMMPKIIALYDRTDSCVEEGRCRERREQIEEKLDNIPPLKAIAHSHSKQLARHNEILENMMTDAG